MKTRAKPLFSIGVTTYERSGMLRECLTSILAQTHGDLEVIVGNDCPSESLSPQGVGIFDPRVRFINHAENIGPIRNANALLASSRGEYFTWLADDDLHAPTFLETVHTALEKYQGQDCIFTSYLQGQEPPTWPEEMQDRIESLKGAEFLRRYLSGGVRVIGCYGVFRKKYLDQLGGMEHLGTGRFSPYSDNLLVIQSALLDRVIYIDAPLVFYRIHEGSVSCRSDDVATFASAQRDFCRRSMAILRGLSSKEELPPNVYFLIRRCLVDFSSVVRRAGWVPPGLAVGHLLFATQYVGYLFGSWSFWYGLGVLGKTSLRILRDVSERPLASVLGKEERRIPGGRKPG